MRSQGGLRRIIKSHRSVDNDDYVPKVKNAGSSPLDKGTYPCSATFMLHRTGFKQSIGLKWTEHVPQGFLAVVEMFSMQVSSLWKRQLYSPVLQPNSR